MGIRSAGRYAVHPYILFFFAGQAAFVPFLNYWFMEQGLSSGQIGLLASAGPVVGLLSQPLWGLLSDRFGAAKGILMCCVLAAPLLAFGYAAFAEWMPGLLLTACLFTLFYSAITPISDAVTVEHARLHRQSYGSIRFLGSISFAIAVFGVGRLYDRAGIDWLFGVHLAMMLIVFAALFRLPKPSSAANRPSLRASVQALLGHRPFLGFLACVFLVSVGNQVNNVFFPVYVGHLGGSASANIGLLTSAGAISELPFFLLSGYLIRRFGVVPVFLAASLAAAVRYGVMSMEPSVGVLLANQLLHGATFALFMTVCITFAYEMSPDGMKNTGQTLLAVVSYNAATILASNAGGWVVDEYGFALAYRCGAALALAGGIGFAGFFARRAMRRQGSGLQG